MVVDASFMQTDPNTKKTIISKHTDDLVFYFHVFPVPRNGPGAPLTFDALEALQKQPTFYDDVTFMLKVSIP